MEIFIGKPQKEMVLTSALRQYHAKTCNYDYSVIHLSYGPYIKSDDDLTFLTFVVHTFSQKIEKQ